MVTARGSRGDLIFSQDFGGAEMPVAGTGAYAAAGGTPATVGPFKITGDITRNDSGTVSVAVPNGALRLTSSASADGDSLAVGTEVIFDVALNGTLTLETRVQRPAVTAGAVFVGFVSVNADDFAEAITSTGTALTYISTPSMAGFHLGSQLTATATWHCPFSGGDTTNPTVSTTVVTGTSSSRNVNSVAAVVAVAGEYDLLQIEIFSNATVRWYINEILVQEQASALSTSTDLAGLAVVSSTTTTVASLDLDYLDIRAKRDWSR